MLGQEVKRAQRMTGFSSNLQGRIGYAAPAETADSFSLTPPALRLISGTELEGSITLLFFGYTYCPDECPMHMANIGAALKKLPPGIADQVKLVFVTTDPARDTPVELRRWLDNFDRHFVGLTGTGCSRCGPEGCGGSPGPEDEIRATATIQSPTPILLSHIPKTIWAMSSIQAG